MLHSLREFVARLTSRYRTPPPVEPEPVPIRKNEIEELIDKWESIEPARLNGVFSSDMSILKAHLCRQTVQEYVKHLDFVSDFFVKDTDLKPLMLTYKSEVVYLRDFFVSANGYYLDPVVEGMELKRAVVAFLRHYNQSRTNVSPTFPMQKNVSLTAHLVSELTHLAEVLQL